MIEQAMLFAIGFLIAALFNLALVPLVHNRAVRLTMRRMEASTPFSMAEIQAEKDRLRAEFAMSTRRLEMSVDQLKSRTASQLGEIGKKTMAMNRLARELAEKNDAIATLETREADLREQLRRTEQEFAMKTEAAREAERALAEKEREFASLGSLLGDRTAPTDGAGIEFPALRAQIEGVKSRFQQATEDLRATSTRMDDERKATAAAASDLAHERTKSATLSLRLADLQNQLASQSEDADGLTKRIAELEGQVAEQTRLLALQDQAAKASAEETARAARAAELERDLGVAREENARLKQDLASLRQSAETAWANERVETALLRERINDVAAEVSRLTLALEGEGSPIDKILAEATASSDTGTDVRASEAPAGGDLITRIRALQARASRIAVAPSP